VAPGGKALDVGDVDSGRHGPFEVAGGVHSITAADTALARRHQEYTPTVNPSINHSLSCAAGSAAEL